LGVNINGDLNAREFSEVFVGARREALQLHLVFNGTLRSSTEYKGVLVGDGADISARMTGMQLTRCPGGRCWPVYYGNATVAALIQTAAGIEPRIISVNAPGDGEDAAGLGFTGQDYGFADRAAPYRPSIALIANSGLIAVTYRQAGTLNLALTILDYDRSQFSSTAFRIAAQLKYPPTDPARTRACAVNAADFSSVWCALDLLYFENGTLLGLDGYTLRSWSVTPGGELQLRGSYTFPSAGPLAARPVALQRLDRTHALVLLARSDGHAFTAAFRVGGAADDAGNFADPLCIDRGECPNRLRNTVRPHSGRP
jgi:hypothetical protein